MLVFGLLKIGELVALIASIRSTNSFPSTIRTRFSKSTSTLKNPGRGADHTGETEFERFDNAVRKFCHDIMPKMQISTRAAAASPVLPTRPLQKTAS
jgi:hypothetical protein